MATVCALCVLTFFAGAEWQRMQYREAVDRIAAFERALERN